MADGSARPERTGGPLNARIERAVAALRGEALWGASRAANMLSLQFGARRQAPTERSRDHEVGAHALHVFCAWRLAHDGRIVVASGDLFTPVDPEAELESFDWDEVGATWWDAQWRAFLDAHPADALTVEATTVDAVGGLALTLRNGAQLAVFPNSSPAAHVETEFWRLFEPGTDAPHLVVGTFGVDEEPDADA